MGKRDILLEASEGEGITFSLLAPMGLGKLSRSPSRSSSSGPARPRALILVSPEESLRRHQTLLRKLSRSPSSSDFPRTAVLGLQGNPRREAEEIRGSRLLIGTPSRIIDHLRQGNLTLEKITYLAADVPNPEEDPVFLKDLDFVVAKAEHKGQRILVCRQIPENPEEAAPLTEKLRRPQILSRSDRQTAPGINCKTTTNKELPMDDLEILKEKAEEIVKKIRFDQDPEEMNDYKKAFKKAFPRLMRGYAAGFLFKQYLEGPGGSSSRSGRKKPRSGDKKSRPGSGKPTAPREGDTDLFLSVGKNRRVYPKDIIGLFMATECVEREDIGEIRILDSYSFAGVKKEKAAELIEKLDGTEFRGRNLTVNYSRKNR